VTSINPFSFFVNAGIDQILAGLSKWLIQGAAGLFNAVIAFLEHSTTPNFGAAWFHDRYQATLEIAAATALLLLVICALGAIVAGDPGRLVRAVIVQLPLATLGTVVALVLAQEAVNIVDAVSQQLLPHPGNAVLGIGQHIVGQGAAAAIVAGLLGLAALLLWLELILREAAIYATVILLPFFLAGLVWPTTAKFAVRAVETLAALILSKLVIVAVIALGLNALDLSGAGNLQGLMAGASLTLFASLAPWVLLRLVPVVENAAVTHLEGTARRPLQATQVPGMYHQIPYLLTDALRRGAGEGAAGGTTVSPAAVHAVMASAAMSGGGEDRLDTQPRPLVAPHREPADGG
jgi:hypothetical protein